MDCNKKMKQELGQFYTVNADKILKGIQRPPIGSRVVEPFAGQGDLLEWLGSGYATEAYDIDPKALGVVQRNTLHDPPNYTDAWVLTNPPYYARNKASDKSLYDRYATNDLYKCFLCSLGTQALGGVLIIPAGFFMSPRAGDVRVRAQFLSTYQCVRINYFEEQVFPDTTTAVVAIGFVRAPSTLVAQDIPWFRYPQGDTRTFQIRASHRWIVGGDIYDLPTAPDVRIRRWVEGMELAEGEETTALLLCALDGPGRIRLEVRPGFCYPAKDTSRTYATLVIRGRTLDADAQTTLATRFNQYVDTHRDATWSLFLPHFREEGRKRMPFDLAYCLVLHLLL